MNEDNKIILTDEDGEEVAFEFLDMIEYQDENYAVLLPEDEDDGEVVILQLDDSDDEYENFLDVEDEEILKAVFEIFKEKFKDEFDFGD